MKKKSESTSALIRPRLLRGLIFCAVACSIAAGIVPGFFRSEASPKSPQRTLTFAERVTYQRAIEDVYWRHRIWPKENLNPKPPLDAVMTQAQLEKKVEDYLRNSQGLETPITPGQLQAEMNRMAKNTKQPDVLRELFEALGNDPFIIAECLVRSVLAERFKLDTVEWRKAPLNLLGAEAENQALKLTAPVKGSYTVPAIADPAGVCTDNTWVATTTSNAPATRDVHTAVWTGSEMIVWGGGGSDHGYLNTGGRYTPSTDSWAATNTSNAPAARYIHTAVWTGSEMIIWGGNNGGPALNTGGRYNPIADTWTATTTSSAPEGREWHTAIWTGSEMVVWGGLGESSSLNTGGRYNPATDSWTATNTTNAPGARSNHTAVWTGSEMIIWGGLNGNSDLLTGARYNPIADSWTPTNTTNAPAPRDAHTAAWTGSEMIVWGGQDTGLFVNTGGRYNPNTDIWTATTQTAAPSARAHLSAVWTGSQMIVWGGVGDTGEVNTGGRYNPNSDNWTGTSTVDAPVGRAFHTAVWTDSQMIVWGGYDNNGLLLNTGGRYCAAPLASTPTPTPTASPTPTPTPTPTPMRCDSGIIFNGGFETGHFEGWAIFEPAHPEPIVTNNQRHTGNYSAFVGGSVSQFCGSGSEPSGDSSFFQSFTVSADGGTLSFWHWDCTTDSLEFDWQDAYITDSNGNILQTIFHQCENGQTWLNTTVDMTPYVGMPVGIRFLVHQDGRGNLTGMYVDDVVLYVPCGTPGPTPTPTASPTPTPTATATITPSPTPRQTPTPRQGPSPRSRPTPAPRP